MPYLAALGSPGVDARGTADGRIYLDHHATTPLDPRVAAVVAHHLRHTFGNPSSVDHTFGDEAATVVQEAAADVAALVGARTDNVIFTSGATESINLAMQGFARWTARCLSRSARVAVSAVEHPAVLTTARALAADGQIALTIVPVRADGAADLDALADALRAGIDLLCVMAANHEVGTVNPMDDVGTLAAEAGALLLSDATQAVGKVSIDATRSRIAYLALSGHKLYGPKGVGALFVAPGAPLDPVSYGGGQQRGLRPGTLNVPAIAGLGAACALRGSEMCEDAVRTAESRDELLRRLRLGIPGLVINGSWAARLPGNLNVSIPGVPSHAVIARVRERLAISTGSACTSGIEAPSHVLVAMGLPRSVQESALRFGLGRTTTLTEVATAADLVVKAVADARDHL